MTLYLMVMSVLSEKGVKVSVGRGDVIKVTKMKVDRSS